MADWLTAVDDVDVRGLRVAWSSDFGYAPVDPEVRRITAAAAARFSELGCGVEEVNPGWDDPKDWAALLWDYQSAIRNVDRAREHPEWIEPTLMAQIEHGAHASALDLGRAQLQRTQFYERARQFMDRFDVLLTPTMPVVAWPLYEPPVEIDGQSTPGLLEHLPFTFPFNMTGWPSASVPCGFNSEGLPVGLQISTGWHQDALCLRVAAAFESLQPWEQYRPTL